MSVELDGAELGDERLSRRPGVAIPGASNCRFPRGRDASLRMSQVRLTPLARSSSPLGHRHEAEENLAICPLRAAWVEGSSRDESSPATRALPP